MALVNHTGRLHHGRHRETGANMSKYRNHLPQLGDGLFMTDGGLETTLIYHHGVELPHFAAFDLLRDGAGKAELSRYFACYAGLARRMNLGIVLEAPTWRANADWGMKLGYDAPALSRINREAIALLLEIRAVYETVATKIVVSGNIGPRGDGYQPARRMDARAAREYHAPQIATFADTEADMVAAFTMNYVDEAVGIASAARAAAMPVAISFTVETDGRLPSGETLEEAILRTDGETRAHPVYYMINCAHPAHFSEVLRAGGVWRERIRGLRANASARSHAELDAATELDAGDAPALASQYRALRELLPGLVVAGGCCGTDHTHVGAICEALAG
jgi:S-methylmethionine-dependent homocysteine/selenocysteine methylase